MRKTNCSGDLFLKVEMCCNSQTTSIDAVKTFEFRCHRPHNRRQVRDARSDVTAQLKYHVKDGIRPYYYGYRREGIPDGVVDAGGTRVFKVMTQRYRSCL